MLLLRNATLFDGVTADLTDHIDVLIEGSRIVEVSSTPIRRDGSDVIELAGRVLMPGLIDAHFHAYSPTFHMHTLDTMPRALLVSYAARFLREALQRGFTTVRDPGGGDVGLALAVRKGLINGPRFLFGGKALSQTGGHGDMRPPHEVSSCGCAYSGVITQLVDGPDQVRHVVREELRRGANHIKVMMSGGVASPSDPLWMDQFTDEELRVAVEEAARRHKYVAAHCHTDEAARRCVSLGVRSIEHGTRISDSTARMIAAAPATFTVPTLAVLHQLVDYRESTGMSASSIEKVDGLIADMLSSITNCRRAGVRIGFGTDLFGEAFHALQSREFRHRAEVDRPIDILRSATSVNAEILQMEDQIGIVRAGACADLIALDTNPLEDITCFERWQSEMPLVIAEGRIVRDEISASHSAARRTL